MLARLLAGVLFSLVLIGCTDVGQPRLPNGGPTTAPATKPAAGPFDARLLEIARSYESYGRLDASFVWAPAACAAGPAGPTPPSVALSSSKDSKTHGRKLYSLFVKTLPNGPGEYTLGDKPNPIGQVVVKEA